MSILVNKDSRVMVQGITGSEGSFHASQMLAYGTNIVAGVTPGKGGEVALEGKVPVFNSVEEAKAIKNKEIVDALELPPIKIHCSVLAEDSIKQAIEDYESKQ